MIAFSVGVLFLLVAVLAMYVIRLEQRIRSLEQPKASPAPGPVSHAISQISKMPKTNLPAEWRPPAKRTSMASLRANLASERTEDQAKEERVMGFNG